MFDLKNQSISYKDTLALENISLHIRAGEKVAFIGPSGAGKTTLLYALYERRPDQVAFVHQHYALVPQLSVFHNVYAGKLDSHKTWYNLLNLLKPQKPELACIQPILQSLNMGELLHKRAGALSGGQQQRIAIARALYRNSEIFLGDEPVSSIDPHQAGSVMELIMQSAPTVVLSLHSVDLALQFAQRLVGVRKGQIFFDLPTLDVTKMLLTELYRS